MNKRTFTTICVIFCALFITPKAEAQSFSDWFNKETLGKVAEEVASKFVDFDLEGNWDFTGSAIRLKSSESRFGNLGGGAASTTLESQLNEQLQKYGIKPGSVSFMFNADGTMLITMKERKINGSYTYDKETEELTMKISDRLPIKAKVEVRNSTFSILFKADALLSIIKRVSSAVDMKSIEAVCLLLKEFDGMEVGFNFKEHETQSN